MSTSDESDRYADRSSSGLPPEWLARSGPQPPRAVAFAPPPRHRWIASALSPHTREISFASSAEEAAKADADLVVISHEAAPGALSGRWSLPAPCARAEAGPLLVIIDAPEQARVEWLRRGADLAVGRGIPAAELGAQVEALLRRTADERDRNPLTGLPGNRLLRRCIAAKAAGGETLALVMADIDNFKAYNDRFGHLAGDALICALAEALREATRACAAFIAHVGGDDFAAVCDPAEAGPLAETVAAEFERRRAELPGGPPSLTVVSATVTPEEAEALEGTFRRLARLRREARAGGGEGKREE
ncbi:MAG: diguanylate cyclase domain-containing protein [Armatimonadota bacterium]